MVLLSMIIANLYVIIGSTAHFFEGIAVISPYLTPRVGNNAVSFLALYESGSQFDNHLFSARSAGKQVMAGHDGIGGPASQAFTQYSGVMTSCPMPSYPVGL